MNLRQTILTAISAIVLMGLSAALPISTNVVEEQTSRARTSQTKVSSGAAPSKKALRLLSKSMYKLSHACEA